MASTPAEIFHPALLGCMLRLVDHRPGDAAIDFQCDGCKLTVGAGPRYTSVNIKPRNLVLHTPCALATPTLQHPLVRGTFKLQHEAPTGDDAVVCDACYGAVKGFHYHCSKKTKKGLYLDLHPCCAKLPVSITVQGLTFELRTEVSHRCTSCREMEGYYRPWCYRSNNPDQRVYLHVNCIKAIMESPGGGGGGSGAGDDDDRVMARLRERADKSSKLEARVYKILLILVRVVIRTLLGDSTAIFTEGVSAIMPLC